MVVATDCLRVNAERAGTCTVGAACREAHLIAEVWPVRCGLRDLPSLLCRAGVGHAVGGDKLVEEIFLHGDDGEPGVLEVAEIRGVGTEEPRWHPRGAREPLQPFRQRDDRVAG